MRRNRIEQTFTVTELKKCLLLISKTYNICFLHSIKSSVIFPPNVFNLRRKRSGKVGYYYTIRKYDTKNSEIGPELIPYYNFSYHSIIFGNTPKDALFKLYTKLQGHELRYEDETPYARIPSFSSFSELKLKISIAKQ